MGVNGYVEDDDRYPPTLSIDPEVERQQLNSLARVKQDRDDELVRESVQRIEREAADSTVNLMPALIEASERYVTVGEQMSALESVFGTWFERVIL